MNKTSPVSFPLILKLLLLCVFITASLPAYAAEGFSEINNALFDSPHMKGVTGPGTLIYKYQKISESGGNRKDTIHVNVNNISKNGRSDQTYNFFSGKYNRPYQERKGVLGNAVFMLFLEWDVRELQRQTKGSWRHFQRRIRWAMAEGPQKKRVELTVDGSKIQGIQYSFQPFATDKKNERYGKYAYKYYIFTLSDEIPGMVYEVRTITPKAKKWNKGDAIADEERITFSHFTPSTNK